MTEELVDPKDGSPPIWCALSSREKAYAGLRKFERLWMARGVGHTRILIHGCSADYLNEPILLCANLNHAIQIQESESAMRGRTIDIHSYQPYGVKRPVAVDHLAIETYLLAPVGRYLAELEAEVERLKRLVPEES